MEILAKKLLSKSIVILLVFGLAGCFLPDAASIFREGQKIRTKVGNYKGIVAKAYVDNTYEVTLDSLCGLQKLTMRGNELEKDHEGDKTGSVALP